ncbi:hypothetical protein ACNHYB_05310 [Isoptericola jiangsuensis]|uniref:hypothetical protein n=1 Tax=Isoptericola jiangsuensis TaxID=548579 RepID=UPI003AAC5441
MDALLPLGPAPRPDSDHELANRLRDALVALSGEQVQGLDAAKIMPVLDGSDLATLDIDLTGVAVGVPPADQTAPTPWSPQIEERDAAVLRTLRLDAHPLTAVDLPVDLAAELSGLRFAWVTTDDGLLGAELIKPTNATPVTGHARAATSRAGLAGTVQGLLAVALSSSGLQLTDFDLHIDQTGPRDARIEVVASIKKGMFLSAKVTASAAASIDRQMVLTVDHVKISSGNPIVAAMLAAMRGRIEEAAGRRVDLADALPPGVRLTDVTLDVGDEIVLNARLG